MNIMYERLRNTKKEKLATSFQDMFMDWHEGLARVGIEQDVSFGHVTPHLLLTQIAKDDPDIDRLDFGIPPQLWRSSRMRDSRMRLVDVYKAADDIFKSKKIRYQQKVKINMNRGGKDTSEYDTHNARGARTSFFALRYLGVTDPMIHALLRFHDIKDLTTSENQARSLLKEHLDPLIKKGILPENTIKLLLDLDNNEKRTAEAAKSVQHDQNTPLEFVEGREHTPSSLWKLYEHVTTLHSSDNPDAPNKYLTPKALFDSKSVTTADEYRMHVARLALAVDEFTHKRLNVTSQELQAKALMVLLELWPIARGLDEGILSRYAGDCIAKAFMPRAFSNLSDVVKESYTTDTLEKERKGNTQWLLSCITSGMPDLGVTFLTPMQMMQREYAHLTGTKYKHNKYDVAVPGVAKKMPDGTLTNSNLVDVKTRSSVFWKMIERWNDETKRKALPERVQRLNFGSKEFWEWSLSCHHDIFRSQIIFLGNGFSQENVTHFLDEMEIKVHSDDNRAQVMYPDKWGSEVFESKNEGSGVRANGIYRPVSHTMNFEVQIKDRVAYDETVNGVGILDHAGYKLRHVLGFLHYDVPTIEGIVRGVHNMRMRHLEMTYIFLNGKDRPVLGGSVYRR